MPGDVPPVPTGESTAPTAQSLGQGAAGIALAWVQYASRNPAYWATAHRWIQATTARPISTGTAAGLYAGAPAVTFLLHMADRAFPGRYRRHLNELLPHVTKSAHRRVDDGLTRIAQQRPTCFGEYDLITGLTGLGRLLLSCRPFDTALERILSFLVALTQPIRLDGRWMPGWWVDHDPDPTLPTPGGHANNGIAHGITGPLALLSLAYQIGVRVDGHDTAIDRITAHLRKTACHDADGTWWPHWTSDKNTIPHSHPPRPSWCYGSPGIARALQLAGIARSDIALKRWSESVLIASLSHERYTHQLRDVGICHGWAGAYLTAVHAAKDSASPRLQQLTADLAQQFAKAQTTREHSLLTGAAGAALARLHHDTTTPTLGWEACLLLI
ncbi:lanthionine synthetase C family protein [Stackebrandtia albiflava]|nr:lanthionine synthetase C family protein [Stackebrandtia albiflava]